ncbi:uncharacterized protein LOC125674670 [Ostrea edulis]|uniref:uncharacterized protein LOC125674670 n=1 Tax=Ostrea edulis TaxID=37623 RepID=UPI0024AF1B69|nr:uncharacterized protein LOC125674670 [Ostrea edulis]
MTVVDSTDPEFDKQMVSLCINVGHQKLIAEDGGDLDKRETVGVRVHHVFPAAVQRGLYNYVSYHHIYFIYVYRFFKCCSGYRWDSNAEKCVPCEPGYLGIDCARKCDFPYFGKGCQLYCNCSKDQCNLRKGCPKGDCKPGYFGEFCDLKCRYPSFGTVCQDKCLCEQERCDPVNGCQGSLEGNFMEVVTTPTPKSRMTHNISLSLGHDADVNRKVPSRDTSSVLSTTPDMTKETPLQSDAAAMWKTLNEKEIGMVISITTLGLLFIVLTAMYIWVSHRIRVERNNRRKTTEDLYENSAVYKTRVMCYKMHCYEVHCIKTWCVKPVFVFTYPL